jgi:hypothetical protein
LQERSKILDLVQHDGEESMDLFWFVLSIQGAELEALLAILLVGVVLLISSPFPFSPTSRVFPFAFVSVFFAPILHHVGEVLIDF